MDIIARVFELLLASPSAWAAAVLMAGVLITMMVMGSKSLKMAAPVVRELKDMIDSAGKVTAAQNEGWQGIIDQQIRIQERQEQFYQKNIKEVNDELIKLRRQYEEVSELLRARDKEIIELRKQIIVLEEGDREKTEEIKSLRRALEEVKVERNALSDRVETLSREIESREAKEVKGKVA